MFCSEIILNKNTIVLFITCVMVSKLQLSSATKSSDRKEDFLQKTVDKVQMVTAKLLTLININKTLWNTKQMQQLLSIHWHAQKIVKSNDKIYDDIGIASKTESSNKTIKSLFNLTEIIDKTLNSMIKQHKRYIKEHIKNITLPNRVAFNPYVIIDFYSVVTDILRSTNKLPWDDVSIKKTEANKISNITRRMRKKYNLKIWRSSNFTSDLSNKSRRIFRGKPMKFFKFPFMVSVHVMDEFLCGGSIISKDLVITAASCLQVAYKSRYEKGNPKFLAVRVGSDYTQRFGELVPITEVYFHPLYKPEYLSNNLAIVKINIVEKLGKKLKIRRIEYDREVKKMPDNQTVMLLGWGDKAEGVSGKFNALSFVQLGVYNIEDCTDIYSRDFVTDKNFCAGFVDVGDGACSRDVGGPAVIDGVLVGVVSFGPPVCGTSDAPTVFTQISFYSKWIDSIKAKMPPLRLEGSKEPTFQSSNVTATKEPLRSEIGVTRHQKPTTMGLVPKGIRLVKSILRELIGPNVLTDTFLKSDAEKGEEEEENNSENNLSSIPSLDALRTKTFQIIQSISPENLLSNGLSALKWIDDSSVVKDIKKLLAPVLISKLTLEYRKQLSNAIRTSKHSDQGKVVTDENKIEPTDAEEISGSNEVSNHGKGSGTEYYSDEGISIDVDTTKDIPSHEKYKELFNERTTHFETDVSGNYKRRLENPKKFRHRYSKVTRIIN